MSDKVTPRIIEAALALERDRRYDGKPEGIVASAYLAEHDRRTALETGNKGLREALAERDARIEAAGVVLEAWGCDCACGHHPEEHGPECERCLGCAVQEALLEGRED